MTLLQTALQQNWTIGEFKKRIQEQSSLNNNQFRQLHRGEKTEADIGRNILNTASRLPEFLTSRRSNPPIIDSASLDLNKFVELC